MYYFVYVCSKYKQISGGFESFSVCNTVEYISTCDANGGDSYAKPKWEYLAPMNIRR